MSKQLLLEPNDDLVGAAARRLEGDGPNFSDCIVVFPGKRPAHYLRQELGKRVGSSFIPPRLFSIDEFVDYLCADHLGLKKSTLEPLDAVAILHGLHQRHDERIGGRSFDTLDAFIPLGLRMLAELEELQIHGVPTRKVESSLTVLSTFYRPFYEEVEARGYTTRSLKYRIVAESDLASALAGLRRIILAGFFALTKSETILFSKLTQLENVVFIFQRGRGLEKHLRELELRDLAGLTTSRPSETAWESERKVIYYKSPDSHGQVFGLAAKIKELQGQGHVLDEHTVVVLPGSDVLFPVVHHALSLLPGDGYNISLGYPLTRTPVYGFLGSLMDVVAGMTDGKVYAPEYMRFMLHPYTKNIMLGARADVTRLLLHTIEEQIAQTKSRRFFSLDSLEDDAALLQEAATRAAGVCDGITGEVLRDHLRSIHDHTIRKLMTIGNVGDLVGRCIEILVFLDEYSTAKQHPFFRNYVEALIERLRALDGPLLRESTCAETSDYFTLLRHSIRGAEVPFPGTPLKGLQVLGFLETRNIRFDRVFILDANDDVIPGSGPSSTLIPRSVRESLGLPTQRDRDDIAAYYFDLLVHGAKEVHLFYVEHDRKIRSRFIEQALWQRQQEEPSTDVEMLVRPVRYDMALANDLPAPVAKTDRMIADLRRFTYSATALDTYLHCPLRFYYGYVLRLEEREKVSGEIERVDLGSFVHKVLSVLFAGTVGQTLTEEMLRPQKVEAIVGEMFTEMFGSEFHGGNYLMRKQISSQLIRFLFGYQLPLLKRERITVLSLEERVETRSRGFVFKGFLDRVEERGKRTVIIDYKTGGDDRSLRVHFDRLSVENRASWEESIGSLQLPLYALLYSTRHKRDVRTISPAYIFLGKNRMDESIEARLFEGDESQQEQYALLEGIIFRLLEEITDVAVPFVRPNDLKNNCPTCPFRAICGTEWVRGRAYA